MIRLEDRLRFAADYLYRVLKLLAPKDTGNLSANAIRIVQVAPNEWNIIIGGELAPYALYTNEPWISARWGKKVNPNEGWIQRAISLAYPMIQTIMSGSISEDDLMYTLRSQDIDYDLQLVKLWEDKATLSKYNKMVERFKTSGG
jgi:hypothetical protein